jgi:hypothetical protein
VGRLIRLLLRDGSLRCSVNSIDPGGSRGKKKDAQERG